jgi:hypothetical protein
MVRAGTARSTPMKIGKGSLADAIAEALSGVVLPPGASVTLGLEISENGDARVVREPGGVEYPRSAGFQDPLGGPPFYVSNRVVPDALALYMLSTAIIDCSRALESHEAEIKAAHETQAKLEAAYRRQSRASIGVMIVCGLLFLASTASLTMSMWGHFHGG